MDDAAAGRQVRAGGRRRVDLGRASAAGAEISKTKPWLKEQWYIFELSAEYIWRMEDVLDLSGEAPHPLRPLVCFDERPVQLCHHAPNLYNNRDGASTGSGIGKEGLRYATQHVTESTIVVLH